jgi:hypothetical protein
MTNRLFCFPAIVQFTLLVKFLFLLNRTFFSIQVLSFYFQINLNILHCVQPDLDLIKETFSLPIWQDFDRCQLNY